MVGLVYVVLCWVSEMVKMFYWLMCCLIFLNFVLVINWFILVCVWWCMI